MSQELFASVENSLKVLRKEVMAIPELKDSEKDINEIIENMNSPLLVMVMGEFSRGKSTFINALIGQSIAKVDANPTTAVITKLSYGTQDEITVFMRDGSARSYDTDSFAALTAEGDEEAGKLHERIDYVERKMPIDILKTMSIIDSPGLNSIKTVHEETTKNFMDKSDMVIWLFDAQDPGKSTEIDAMKRLNPRLSPLVLVNKMDAINEDEGDSPEKIISKIERDLSNNKLEYQKIIGISAKMAFQGKIKNNEKLIAESNIGEFYDTVDTLILPNREQYKRNSMLDGLSKMMFSMGNDLNDKSEENKARKSSDYASYIETEERLAGLIDELENIADTVMTTIESMQTMRRRRLNATEKTFYGVLYWLGLFVEKNDEQAQQYLEEASVRNDGAAQLILAGVCSRLGQIKKARYWQERLGIQDNAFADTLCQEGEKYYNAKDYANALKCFQGAAALGHVDGMKNVGYMYDNGLGVAQDYKEALRWYKKAAESGNASAMNNLGYMYQEGLGVAQDYNEALSWYKKAAELGIAAAMNNVGYMYQEGLGVAQDYGEALSWYKKAVELGNATAMNSIGCMYQDGCGVAKNQCEAIRWYRQSAELGNVNGMLLLGFMYRINKKPEAIQWFQKAAELGCDMAMCIVGDMYCEGEGVTQDYSVALKWFHRAADAGDASAMDRIGRLYRDGAGVGQNYEEAIKWYRKAMDAGYKESEQKVKDLELLLKTGVSQISDIDQIYATGRAYHFGEGVEKNYTKAANYYLEAANLGHDDAMKMVGYMYKNGFGVVQSYVKAEEWYRKAISAGNKYAERELSRMLFAIKEENKQKSSCFITSAVCESFGKSDDCYELAAFRNFRDNWLKKQADGKTLISEYYHVAPYIVEQIKLCSDAQEVYRKIWEQYLRPCLHYIEQGDNSHCKKMYVAMVNNLREKFLQTNNKQLRET